MITVWPSSLCVY